MHKAALVDDLSAGKRHKIAREEDRKLRTAGSSLASREGGSEGGVKVLWRRNEGGVGRKGECSSG